MLYYHGSTIYLPVGTLLRPGIDYEKHWASTDFYTALEHYRPTGKLAHKDAVFMCESEDDVDLCGGGTEWLFSVNPLGPVHKHDVNWSSEISCLISKGYSINSPEVESAASSYWNSMPHYNESVWEYLTPSATILKVVRY